MQKNKATALILGIISFISPNRREGSCLLEIVIFVIVVFVLASMSTPNIYPARGNARLKACYCNMRIIQSACEMYEMDHASLPPVLDMPLLIKEGYLKSELTCPDSGSYSLVSDDYMKGDIIADCSKHGTIEPSAAEAAERALTNKRKEKISVFKNKLHQSRIVTLIVIIFVYTFYFLLTIFFTADIEPPKTIDYSLK